ncbi:hypothetical protein C8J57DRAFT_1239248 [Mycena rebaudengoi]|nr:hypothetical protein C8J57DRAFT_1239248 [Mycena rebaudengoi]
MKRRVKGSRTTRISAPLVVLLGYPAGRSPNIDMDRDPPFTVEVSGHSIANKSFGMRMTAPRCMWVIKKMMKRAHLPFDVVSGPRDFNNTIIFHEHELVGFHQRGIKFDSEYLNNPFRLQEVSTSRRRRVTPAHAAAYASAIKRQSRKSFNSPGLTSSQKMKVIKHRVLGGSWVMTGDEHRKRKGVPRSTGDQHSPSRKGKIVQVGRTHVRILFQRTAKIGFKPGSNGLQR